MTSYSDIIKKSVRSLPVYEPGQPIEMVSRAFDLDPGDIIKLASNENPLGPSPKAIAAGRAALDGISLYPENSSHFLRERLAAKRGVQPDQLIIGHGSNEIIYLLCSAIVAPGTQVVMGEHAFISYKLATLLEGGTPVEAPLVDLRHDLEAMAQAITADTRLVFLPSPNNPTGTSNTQEEILAFLKNLPDHVIFCLDLAYAEYLDDPPDLNALLATGKKVIGLRTFSKIYGLAGLRIGYGVGDPELVGLLNRVRPPFNVNAVAQAAALAALDDDAFIEKSRQCNRDGLIQLADGLNERGIEFRAGDGNFILVSFQNSDKVFEGLQAKGIIVRPLKGYALPQYLRVTVGTQTQNRRLLAALTECLED